MKPKILEQSHGSGDKLFAKRRPGWEPAELPPLQLSPFTPLESSGRQPCPKCGRSRALYCCYCLVPFTPTPRIELPFELYVVSQEQATKATGTHAAVLCPGCVHMHRLDELPALDPATTVVLFPSDDAVTPDQLELQQMQHVVAIDAKWKKATDLNERPAFAGMTRVKLPGNPRSCFWRHHTHGTTEEGVCTIEAVHLLMQALADRLPQEPAHWDNLLWYFAYQHKVVEQAHAQRTATRQQAAAKQAQAAGEPAQGPGQQLQPGDEELAPLVAPGAQQQSTAKRAKVDATP